MKTIKFILGFITIITLIFFATGSFIKETSYSTSIKIDKPIAEVFQEFNNMDNTQKWIPEIKKIDTVQSNYVKTGRKYIIF